MSQLGELVRGAANVHRQGERPSVAIVSTPRSGSTWLAELIRTQPGFKSCDEPFNIRTPAVRRHLGFDSWDDFAAPGADERIVEYLQGFLDGRTGFLNHRPFRPHHRWRTDRIVFRLLHAGEDRIDLLRGLGLEVVHLVRHPLAVSLSRQELPRLPQAMAGTYLAGADASARGLARRVAADGTDLERAVLAWTLHNGPVLTTGPPVTLVTYEHLIDRPETTVAALASRLQLPDPERLLDRLDRPSGSSTKSTADRRQLLAADGPERIEAILGSWRQRIDTAQAERAMVIPAAFGIDLYRADEPLPIAAPPIDMRDCPTP